MHGTEEKMKNFNMMKKLLALTLGAAMLLAVMTGCGKKDTAQEPADDQQQQQEEQQSAEVIGFDVFRRARFGAADEEELADLFLKAHVCDDVVDALVGRFFHRLLDRRFRRRIDGGFIGGVYFRAAGGEKQNQDEGKCGDFERFHGDSPFYDSETKCCSR